MAKEKQDTNQTVQSPKPQGSEKKNRLLLGLLAFLTAVAVMAVVIAGAFYIIIHNNVGGAADKYRNTIKGISVLKWMLPKPPDPEDPKYLTDSEIRSKYTEIKNKKDDLEKQLEEANKKIAELQKYKDEQDKIIAENEKAKTDLEAKQKQLAEDKKKLDEMIASGDKAGFKDYYEKLDPENAQRIYAQIVQEQKASDDAVNFAKIYEGMDPAAAAKIFEQMGNSKLDLIIQILKNMKRDSASQVIAAMSPSFASTVTDRLSKAYLGTQNNTQSTSTQ